MKKEYYLEADGFRAVWFEGSKYPGKAIIYMAGAKCGEKDTINSSLVLRNEGYSVLCLGFYLWDGMPKEMYKIPVEYVEKAVAELKANGYEKIAIHGMSTGAGYALLCSSLIPDISCTIATVPYDYVMEGMKHDLFPLGFAVYTYRGKSVPFSHYTCMNNGLLKALKGYFKFRKQNGNKEIRAGRYGYDTSEETEESRIKVENMKSDLLIMAPEWDEAWPSEQAVPRIERILKEHNYPYRVKAIIYEKASHALGAELSGNMGKLAKKLMPSERKYPDECERARKDSIQQIINFLKEW